MMIIVIVKIYVITVMKRIHNRLNLILTEICKYVSLI